MIKTSVVVNRSFEQLQKDTEILNDQFTERKLFDIAETAVNASPVDTGAYVTSFSFNVGGGRPRGKSSENKPKKQDISGKRQEGLANLASDIARAKNLGKITTIELRNAAPHATDVEYGENWSKTSGYFVFAKVRNIHG